MFKRRTKSKNSFPVLQSSNRGSDIVRPNNTSLIVNESDTETDELPRELTSILSEDEDDFAKTVRSSSLLMKSLSQKTQSTPKQSSNPSKALKENRSPNFPRKKVNPSQNLVKTSQSKPSYFVEVVKACGATPLLGNSSYLMSVDQAVFSIRVNNKLKDNEENTKKFLKSLEEEIEDIEKLQKMLVHTLTAEDCAVARGPVQEPLMRLLLNVDCIQAEVLEVLLKKLANLILDGKLEENDPHTVSSILRQIRFLNKVKNVKVASTLFEIIHVASANVQREIIFFLPEVISEDETEETCTQLIDLLKFDAKLTLVIIDALTNLPLKKTVESQVRAKILNRLDKTPSEFLPSIVQFLLNRCDPDELTEVIIGLRHNLPFTPQHFQMKKAEVNKSKKTDDDDSYIKLTFENLKFSVMASKNMTEIWIKVISNLNTSADFKCVDLTMLIIFYNCLFGRKNQILALIRNKVKMLVLSQTHVLDMFKILKVVTNEYFSTILEVASVLIKSFEDRISDFGALLYKECFIHFNFYMQQTVISEILLHVGTGSPTVVNTALATLKELSNTHEEDLSRHTISIMGLVIKIPDLDLIQVRLLMDVIGALVFSEFAADSAGWQDELQIFIRKQLVSSKLEQSKKGIVAAIMFGKHAGKKEADEDFDYSQIDSLLEMAMGSNGTSESKRGFFNDEFATMVKESELNKTFLESWRKKVYKLVMENLFVKNIDVECSDFPMFLQFALDEKDSHKLVFPVVVFIINSNLNKSLSVPVSVIPSILRLLWCLETKFNKISPVFHASAIMPESGVYEGFHNFDEDQQKKVIGCLFLCANYLIECINALCVQGDVNKALLRIKQLIKVRKLISNHIPMIPDYVPYLCQFYLPVQKVAPKKKPVEKKPKKGKKRKIDEVTAETSVASLAPQTQDASSVEIIGQNEQPFGDGDLHHFSGYFRELQCVAYKLLKADLKLNTEVNQTTQSTDEDYCSYKPLEKAELLTSDVLFLLEDLICKADQVLKDSKRALILKKKVNFSAIENIAPEEFVSASIAILPFVLSKVKVFSAYSKNLLKANDWVYDALGMYSKEASDVKLALAAGLKFVSDIVTWKGFQNSNNKNLFRDVLTILSKRGKSREGSSTLPPISVLASEAADHLAEYAQSVLILSAGLSIVKAFEACLDYCLNKNSKDLAKLCYDLLSRSWYTISGAVEKGSIYNQNLDCLLRTYFASVDNKLEVVRSTAKIALAEVEQLIGKDSRMETLKTINKSNFPLLFRAMCEALASASTEEFSKIKNNDQLVLDIWSTVVEILLVFVSIAKIHSSRTNLVSLLKRSQSIIQLFLNKGLPAAESALRVKSIEVLSLLKSFQTVTRFLHSICCHSKITNDPVVAAHVPIIRSLCERLTLEVKGILIVNKIPMECITIAILKNRDLKGNDIVSQETINDYSDDDSELPPEDTPNDEQVTEEYKIETQESNSETY